MSGGILSRNTGRIFRDFAKSVFVLIPALVGNKTVRTVFAFAVKKAAVIIVTLFIIMTATFFLVNAIPGSELDARIERMSQDTINRMYVQYGLNKPLIERYFVTLKGMLHGDFGLSVAFEGDTVQNILKTRLPISARLGLQQMGLGVFLGLLFGIISARTNGSWPDYLIITFAVMGISMPPIVCALLLQKFFAGRGLLGLPVIGWGTVRQSILPTLAGGIRYISFYARLMKSSMLDVMGQDYILSAEAKGLRKTRIIMAHALRNSFIPIVTYLPMSMAMCITGSFFIESVFSIPGLGYYFVNAVAKRDTPIVLGLTVFLSGLYLFVVFITDILYKLIDPRIRLGGDR